MKILIVDDEPAVLEGMKIMMDWNSLRIDEIVTLKNGKEVIDSIHLIEPDLILTDINMPVISGLEMIAVLRNNGHTMPIIILSGYDTFEYAKKALQYDVLDYVLKPIDEDELYKSLEKAVERIEALKDDVKVILPEDSMAYKIVYYMNHHYNEPMRLKTLAEEFHLTPAYLGQIIKKSTGLLFNDYLTQLRMDAAKEYLKSTEMMVYEIALKCGFKDTDYFTKKFALVIGTPPMNYRNQYRER
jgi:two-component system response regulator YesN